MSGYELLNKMFNVRRKKEQNQCRKNLILIQYDDYTDYRIS